MAHGTTVGESCGIHPRLIIGVSCSEVCEERSKERYIIYVDFTGRATALTAIPGRRRVSTQGDGRRNALGVHDNKAVHFRRRVEAIIGFGAVCAPSNARGWQNLLDKSAGPWSECETWFGQD